MRTCSFSSFETSRGSMSSTIALEYSAARISSSEIFLVVGLMKAPLESGFAAKSKRNSGLNCLAKSNS